jgi:hypothetical protein
MRGLRLARRGVLTPARWERHFGGLCPAAGAQRFFFAGFCAL